MRAQLQLMTSWALVGDVWFLEPQKRLEGESAIDFAARVQAMIAARAKLEIVPWDGWACRPHAWLSGCLFATQARAGPGRCARQAADRAAGGGHDKKTIGFASPGYVMAIDPRLMGLHAR